MVATYNFASVYYNVKLLFNTKCEFCLLIRRINLLQITVILAVSTKFGENQLYWGLWTLPLCPQVAE